MQPGASERLLCRKSCADENDGLFLCRVLTLAGYVRSNRVRDPCSHRGQSVMLVARSMHPLLSNLDGPKILQLALSPKWGTAWCDDGFGFRVPRMPTVGP